MSFRASMAEEFRHHYLWYELSLWDRLRFPLLDGFDLENEVIDTVLQALHEP